MKVLSVVLYNLYSSEKISFCVKMRPLWLLQWAVLRDKVFVVTSVRRTDCDMRQLLAAHWQWLAAGWPVFIFILEERFPRHHNTGSWPTWYFYPVITTHCDTIPNNIHNTPIQWSQSAVKCNTFSTHKGLCVNINTIWRKNIILTLSCFVWVRLSEVHPCLLYSVCVVYTRGMVHCTNRNINLSYNYGSINHRHHR